MAAFGQFAATSQFFLWGRRAFTRTGWEKHRKGYEQPDILGDFSGLDLSGRIYMITGANSGIGFEITRFLASRGATVHMVCRSRERAEEARSEIALATGSDRVHVTVADVGLEADVRRCWREFAATFGDAAPRLDALVCNAGALLNQKTLTGEGVEATFACHLLFGTFLLGSLALPTLEATPSSRLVVVSSGGMYNTPFPAWSVATSTSTDPSWTYDGQLAYAYAKRGQVLLCERWALQHPAVKIVSCHPGWTSTPGVEDAYGSRKQFLEPLRSLWEGAEGIVWLCVAPEEKLSSGAFYLDRSPQTKHVAGPFFTEGGFTKNSPEEIDAMMRDLEVWSGDQRPGGLADKAELREAAALARATPLAAMEQYVDIGRFMGRWYVIANIPTFFDRGTANNIEDYAWDEAQNVVNVTFSSSNAALTKTTQLLQQATIRNAANTEWAISPKVGVVLPVKLAYLIVDCAEDYSTCIIGVPDRSYVWVMARTPRVEPAVMQALVTKVQLSGYDVAKLVAVPQEWREGAEAPVTEVVDQAIKVAEESEHVTPALGA